MICPTILEDLVLAYPLPTDQSFAIRCLNIQNRIGSIDISDTLTESMLDHRMVTPKLKTSTRLHGNAPAQTGTNASLHGNAFRLFMVQLGASKKVPPNAPDCYFLILFDAF